MLRNPHFCSFALFSVVLLATFINKPDSSRDLTIFIILFISLFEINIVVIRSPKILLCIQVSAADSAAFNPTGINTLLAKALSTFFIKGKSVFSNG